jgi:undecaprenyl-diphosphatase
MSVPSLFARAKPIGQSLLALARGEITAVAAMLILAGSVLAFIDIAEDFSEDEARTFDTDVLHAFHPGPDPADPIGPEWLDHAVRDFTALGSLAILLTIALIAIGFLVMQRRRLQALMLALSLAGGLALSELLKHVFERTRPPEIYHAAGTLNASFPSGHALLSTVFYVTLGAMLARTLKTRAQKVYALGVGLLLAMLVGASRVYLGVHWASDVLAGWCVGAAWAMACWLLEWAVERKARAIPSPETPAGSG